MMTAADPSHDAEVDALLSRRIREVVKSEEFHRMMEAISSLEVIILDNWGSIVFANATFYEWSGFGIDDFASQRVRWSDIIDPAILIPTTTSFLLQYLNPCSRCYSQTISARRRGKDVSSSAPALIGFARDPWWFPLLFICLSNRRECETP
jgi:hypothetical protein